MGLRLSGHGLVGAGDECSLVLCRPCLHSAGSSRAATAAAASAAAVTAAAGSVNPNLPRAKSRSTTSLQRIWRHSCSQMKGVGKKHRGEVSRMTIIL